MPIITDDSGRLYRQVTYASEAAFERTVAELADRVFGSSTLYVPVKKKMKGSDIVTIPDGYVLDMTEAESPTLYVVENEIASHDPLRHIGNQLLRFATSFDEARTQVRRYLMDAIAASPASMARLEAGSRGSSKRNVDNYLDAALDGPFRGLVVIDEARPDVYAVIGKIKAEISVLELRTYRAEDGAVLHVFDTLYDEDEPEPTGGASEPPSSTERSARRERRAHSDTIVVPARAEGFAKVFIGESRWRAIRIGAAMKGRIRYIAAYQVAPVSAVTHIAEIQEIRPVGDAGKYEVVFRGPAQEIRHVPLGKSKTAPQGPLYVQREKLMRAKTLEDALA